MTVRKHLLEVFQSWLPLVGPDAQACLPVSDHKKTIATWEPPPTGECVRCHHHSRPARAICEHRTSAPCSSRNYWTTSSVAGRWGRNQNQWHLISDLVTIIHIFTYLLFVISFPHLWPWSRGDFFRRVRRSFASNGTLGYSLQWPCLSDISKPLTMLRTNHNITISNLSKPTLTSVPTTPDPSTAHDSTLSLRNCAQQTPSWKPSNGTLLDYVKPNWRTFSLGS